MISDWTADFDALAHAQDKQIAATYGLNPAAGILSALSEPLGLTGASLPAYGIPGDGCCRQCLRPPVHSQGLCVYCGELPEPPEPRDRMVNSNAFRFVVVFGLVMYGVIALFWALGAIQ